MTIEKNWLTIELEDFIALDMQHKRRRRSQQLPTGSGVYARFLSGELLYIGMSSCISYRNKQHGSAIPADTVKYYECNESVARWIERRLIAKHRPRFNTVLK